MNLDFSPSRNPAVRSWKQQGRKAFGVMGRAVPEELVYAAGIFPVQLLGSPQPIRQAMDYLDVWTCHYIQSILDLGLNGEYEVLDGIVIPHLCDATFSLAGALEVFVEVPYFYWLPHPHSAKVAGALPFFVEELTVLKRSIEKFAKTEITKEALTDAIGIYNKNRDLLREIYDLRGKDKPLVSGVEATEMVMSSMLLPKEESNKILTQRIEEIKRREGLQITGPRLLISGSHFHDLGLFKLVESHGAMAVADDLDTGSRYFWESVDIELDPLEAVAKHRLLDNIPDASFAAERATEKRLDYILGMVKRYSVDGVIFALQEWCDTHKYDEPFLKEELRKAGIPTTTIAIGGTSDTPPVKTRLEAFLETF